MVSSLVKIGMFLLGGRLFRLPYHIIIGRESKRVGVGEKKDRVGVK